jgi:hypothetical protein
VGRGMRGGSPPNAAEAVLAPSSRRAQAGTGNDGRERRHVACVFWLDLDLHAHATLDLLAEMWWTRQVKTTISHTCIL